MIAREHVSWAKLKYVVLSTFLIANGVQTQDISNEFFPNDFLFGVATSAYQIEGAWNTNGKGPNIWDTLTHTTAYVQDNSTGDVACDSYAHGVDDVDLLVDLGVDFYRFSLSWARILPMGYAHHVNPDGIRYYNEIIDALLARNITPLVTLYHWDLPQTLQDVGGFANPVLEEYFEDFARVAFEEFGDRVKLWATFNEPMNVCNQGYGGVLKAPALGATGIGDYLCAYTLLKAHARAYHLYDDEFRVVQGGNIFIVLDSPWFEQNSNTTEDVEAARRLREFYLGLYAHPIFTETGDYPPVVKEFVSHRSSQEGFVESRLQEFTAEEIDYIKGTSDWFGINHYTTRLVANVPEHPIEGEPGYGKDVRVQLFLDESWPNTASPWLQVVPWGFESLLVWIKEQYGDIPVFITENGYSDYGDLDDENRIEYHRQYLSSVLNAIHTHGVNIKAYTFWTFLDNFEWFEGYIAKFGLYHVNFDDPLRPRTPKSSVGVVRSIIANRRLVENGTDGGNGTAPPGGDRSSETTAFFALVVGMLFTIVILYQ